MMKYLVFFLLTGSLAYAELPPVTAPPENPITEEKRVLGKILFWDEQLSSDNTVACGTCHIPSAGGADPRTGIHPGSDSLLGTQDDVIGSLGIARQISTGEKIDDLLFGFGPQVTARAAPSNIMAMYADFLFWDGRAESAFNDPLNVSVELIGSGGALENQAIAPILSEVEMAHVGRTWDEVVGKLERVIPLRLASNIPPDMSLALADNPRGYAALFANAFGDDAITPARIAMAIATYQRTLVPDQAPWDLYQAGDESAMTASQIAGWIDFRDNTVCDNCHSVPQFTDNAFHNIGLRPAQEDIGRQEVTERSADFGRFKTPTLRNTGLRSALMHVGWITSVRDAVDFYNASADEENGIANPHTQFLADQTGIPAQNRPDVDYDTLSMFSRSEERKDQVVDFIANGLTDPRVAAETFPFDRPTLASELGGGGEGASDVSIMTYNVNTIDWTQERADLISQVILGESPDVISLQEAGNRVLPDIEARLSSEYQIFSFPEAASNTNAILVKHDTFNVVDSGITADNEMLFCVQNRYVAYVVLETLLSGRRFTVHNSQFCSSFTTQDRLPEGFTALEVNEAHAAILADTIASNLALYGGVAIVAGDLNARVDSATMLYLLEQNPLSAAGANTVALDDSWALVNTAPKSGVDWVLVTADSIEVLGADFIETDLTPAASDHLPFLATLQFADQNPNVESAGPLSAGELFAPEDIFAVPGSVDTVMLRFSLDSPDGASEISAITLQASGTGDDSADLLSVNLYLDGNGNGNIDAGERLLGQGVFATDNGQLRLQLEEPFVLPVGTTEFIVAYDFL